MTDGKTKVILHAEDEPAHARVVHVAIQRNFGDVQLKQVDNGKAALDYLYHRGSYKEPKISPRPDLILLDLRMPLMGGLEVLAIIKKDSAIQMIPAVVLTTSASEKDRSEAESCGADGYLIKPLDFDQFVHLMENLYATWL